MEDIMERDYNLRLTEDELHALEVILSCINSEKLVNTNALTLSLHHLKLSDIFLTLEKLQDFIAENIKRDGE